ncbi:MAG TPA: hypothetical protein VMZ28_01670 [Kofleriaceae bacterium]|nr:hypothetical protein [Kofleriaceae bacterium]
MKRGWLLPIAIALVAHGAALGGGFAADDMPDIVAHPVVRGDAAPWQVYEYNYMGAPIGEGANTVRPLATLLFAAEWAAWGERPALFHAVSLLLFCGCVWVAYRYARLLAGDGVALATAALFASLAIHVDAVGLVANSAEVLSLGLALAALWAAARGRAGLAALAYAAALLSKESAIGVPAVAAAQLLFLTARGSAERRAGARALAAMLVAAAVYLAARAALLDFDVEGSIIAADNPLLDAPAGTRLWMPLVLLGKYLATTMAPLSLAFDHTWNDVPAVVDLADPHGWLGLAAVIGFAAAAVAAWRRRAPRRSKVGICGDDQPDVAGPGAALVALVGFAAAYALFSNSVFLIVTIYAERLFLAPSFWVCLAAAMGARWLAEREPSARRGLVGLAALVIASQVALSALRSREIGSNMDLLASQVESAPDSLKGRLHYARELAARGHAEEATWHIAVTYAGRRAFPDPSWRAPRDVEELPVEERLARLPELVAPGTAPAEYWRRLRPVARRFVGPQALPVIDRYARGAR